MIAKPSQFKKSTIQKSKIQKKIGKSSPRPPINTISSGNSTEKKSIEKKN